MLNLRIRVDNRHETYVLAACLGSQRPLRLIYPWSNALMYRSGINDFKQLITAAFSSFDFYPWYKIHMSFHFCHTRDMATYTEAYAICRTYTKHVVLAKITCPLFSLVVDSHGKSQFQGKIQLILTCTKPAWQYKILYLFPFLLVNLAL